MTNVRAWLAPAVLAMAVGLVPVPGEAEGAAAPAVTLAPVPDQVARVVTASATGGVDWGNEPVVVRVRVTPADAALSVAVAPAALLTTRLGGADGHVLTLTPTGATGVARVTVTATGRGETADTSFAVQVDAYADTGRYRWSDMPIPGGGFVTGFVFHPRVPDILYARTDVGGAWRFDVATGRWEGITNWVRDDIGGNPGQPIGLALDPDPARAGHVYLAYGASGTIVRSTDHGRTWVRLGNTGGSAAGNVDSRGAGERLVVLPGDGRTMYFAGTTGGLRRSVDGGLTWTGVPLTHGHGRNPTTNETKLTFVDYDPANPDLVVVGTAGANGNPVDSPLTRGPSVFLSTDGGATFAELPDQPLPGAQVTTGTRSYGYVGYRSAFSPPDTAGHRYLFVTYSDSGAAAVGMEGQGVDGALFRYQLDERGAVLGWANVTPVRVTGTAVKNADGPRANRQLGVGVGGVSVDPRRPGVLVVSTHNSDVNSPDPARGVRSMDTVFRSLDYGRTWFPVLAGYRRYGDIDPISDLAPYAGPLANGAVDGTGAPPHWEPWTPVHWNTAPTINPFDSDMMVFNTGIGAYLTHNLTALDAIGAAEPHAEPAAGLDPREGLFVTGAAQADGARDSRYVPYLIGNPVNHLTAARSVRWEATLGLEMTVHMAGGLHSPPSGDVVALDMVGDYGGFAFTSTTSPPANAFAFTRGVPPEFRDLTGGRDTAPTDRWITGRNASFAALDPDVMVATVSGSWHFNSFGGVAVTFDNAKTWHSIADGWSGGAGREEYARLGIGAGMPTPALQTRVDNLKLTANTSSGHAVVTADGRAVLWSVGDLDVTSQVHTADFGRTWTPVRYLDGAGRPVQSGTTYLVPDNVDPALVYAFGTTTYVSRDGGRTFRQAATAYGGFATAGLAAVNGTRDIRADLDTAGVVEVGGNGLWRLTYDAASNTMSAAPVPAPTTVARFGPGIGVHADPAAKALYVYGSRPGSGRQSGFGVWRSLDRGASWTKITDSTDNPSPAGTPDDPYLNANVQHADVRGVVGDSRAFGRVYVSLGNAPGGLRVGEPVLTLVRAGRPAVDTDGFDVGHLDMVDDDALPQTRSLFAYLRNVGAAGYTLFGHQNDTTDRIIRSGTAVNWSGVDSDVFNAVGDFPAVHGYSPNQVTQVQDAHRKGAIVAVEHHIGFSAARGVGSGSFGNTTDPVDPVRRVLPGGPLHDSLKAYLDTVATWAGQYVDDEGNLIPVIYRPWHEHNGDWFWWGTSNATEGEFRELFRFTVHYLRDVKGVANLLYAFSPNGHFENEQEYLYGYPGDEYVDLLGVDVYDDVPQGNPGWWDLLVKDLRIAATYAERTGKIAALTETGIRWDASNGLKLRGAAYGLDWFTTLQSRIRADPVARRIAYLLVWRNGSTEHFWVPFRGHNVLGDHEMLPDFTDYHHRPDVVFASRVGDYRSLVPPGAPTTGNAPSVTIHTPVLKERVSRTTRVRVHAAAGEVPGAGRARTRVVPDTVTVTLGGIDHPATRETGTLFWTADVDTMPVGDGRHRLTARATYRSGDEGGPPYDAVDGHDVVVANRPGPVGVDPYLIDDFEAYDGTDDDRTDLERVWRRDGDTMNALRLRDSDPGAGGWLGEAWSDGMDTGTVLRIKYDAVRGSFSQVTRALPDADWSGAESLRMWVQPDGKGYDLRLRFVVAGGGSVDARTFEVSLADDLVRYGYDPFRRAPQHVAVDLAAFRSVGTSLPATAEQLAAVTSFSLRFVQQSGRPEMAGLNAVEYYLLDDLRVSRVPAPRPG